MAEKILAADNIPPARPISQLVNRRLFSGLQRQIKSKFLIDLIKTGRLEPRTYQVGSNEEETSLTGVYLELHRTDNPKPFEWGDVELDFDLSVLNALPFSSVRKIFVLGEKKRQEILQQIKASGLKCPQRGGCEALIESR